MGQSGAGRLLVGVLVQRLHLRLGDRPRSGRIQAGAEQVLTQNEIDAANQVHFDELNVQNQPKITWPANFVVARAYIDQLARSKALAQRIATR